MLINVNQEDIDQGVFMDRCKCPIARAMTRIGLVSPQVDYIQASHVVDGKRVYIRLPPRARMFMCAFDFHAKVAPFNFEL